MGKIEEIEEMLKSQKEMLRREYGVKKIALFGSFARREQKETSDIDILVEFEKPLGLKFIELADYLEKILGVRVELFTPEALKQKPRIWESVQEDMIYV